jgi:hypothetical protein
MPKDDVNDDRRKHEEEQAEDKAGERFSARLSRTDGRFYRARDCEGGIRRRWNATESRSTFAAELRSVSGRRTAWLQKIVRPPKKRLKSGLWLSFPGADGNLVFCKTPAQDALVIAKGGSARHNNERCQTIPTQLS